MPEYLAPGVYVEETSFRAKSIEGVGTSTTGFAGPTRKGPVGDTPEIITSFGDFERIYGGFDELNLPSRLNYVAHSVNAYFNNGGTRLYVSRVFLGRSATDTGLASSADVNGSADVTRQAFFRSRTPGGAGNGQIYLREADAPATVRSMGGAPEGSLLRLGGDRVAAGAQITGAAPPFRVPNDGSLLLTVNGTDVAISFHGEPAEVTGAPIAAFPVAIDNTNNTLNVVIDGVAQTITLANGNLQLQDLDDAINRSIRGGFARFTPDNRLVIGSDRRGRLASVTVRTNAALGFAADTTVLGTATAANNVGDLGAVTADEINVLLGPLNARAALNPRTGMLVLSTLATGTAATLGVRDGANSAHSIFGLTAPAQATGAAGSTNTFYVKRGGNWLDSAGVPLNLGGL